MEPILTVQGRLPTVPLATHELPGVLVAVDGSDGTGKTTLLSGLESTLRASGFQVLSTRQPTTEGRNSEASRDFLFKPESRDEIDYRALLCLMIGDRLQHLHRVVKPALKRGEVVLCDRYIFTQMVTTVTRGFEDEPWMLDLYAHVLRPDVGIVTDSPVNVAVERISSRSDSREAFYEEDHVRKNLEAYRQVAEIYDLTVVDTHELSRSEVLEAALERIGRALSVKSASRIDHLDSDTRSAKEEEA